MKDYIDYKYLVDKAMKGVVKTVLSKVAKEGLQGEHYFFISFFTRGRGVVMSDTLLKKFDKEMMVVLQHQYEHLIVRDEHFSVTLRFDGKPENLVIPFDSIISFVDPSTKFAVGFDVDQSFEDIKSVDKFNKDSSDIEENNDGNIIALSKFRKNK